MPEFRHSPRTRDERVRLADQWDKGLAEARLIDGCQDLFRPPRGAALLPREGVGPIVIPMISARRCDALLVTSSGVDAVKLSRMTAEDTVAVIDQYLRATYLLQQTNEYYAETKQRFANGDRGPAGFRAYHDARTKLAECRSLVEDILNHLLRGLWEAVAKPIFDALRIAPGPEEKRPRLWWCPTGPLTLLPFHAAGSNERPGETVLDHVISSYTPTLRVLLDDVRDKETWRGPGGDERLLLVSVPKAEGYPPLPNVEVEREILKSMFAPEEITDLAGPEASRTRVLNELDRHRWVHFSCHGDQDLASPASGSLVVHDGRISIAEIGAASRAGEFAFLSACKTATGSVVMPNEAMNIAAALRYSGYRHVLATLWSIYDATAPNLVTDVYTKLRATGRFRPDAAATALDDAVRALKRADPRLSTWTPFIHLGP